MTFQSINPTTGQPFASYEEWPTEGALHVVGKVHHEFLAWRRTGFDHRASLMRNAAKILNKNARDYAKLMAEEMGKPLHDGVAEAEKCAQACEFFADNAENFLTRHPVWTEARKTFVAFNPLGVVLAVIPGILHSGRSFALQRRA
jgi:succinate-semialdehyde dehydrogenase/glutarate-semialdehyde dehydrogenase